MTDYPPKVENAAAQLAHYLKQAQPAFEFFSTDMETEMRAIVYDLYDALREEIKK